MKLRPVVVVLVAALVAACAAPPPTPYAVAVLKATHGNSAAGTVWFQQSGADVLVRGRVTGLAPDRQHGFHVHEKGDCSSGDGMSSGAHLNPTGMPHGPQSGAHHAGDLPALQADANGAAQIRMRVAGSVFGPGAAALAGKGLIVHAGADDYATQPTGNSGAPIACGVISTVAGRDAAGNEVAPPKDL
jgi:superoxide dismutase, Cu-Zn family